MIACLKIPTAPLRHVMTLSTQVLLCDASAISFKGSSDLPIITSPETLNAIRVASHHLLDLLQPVAFPTETVYGLGALALNDGAASRIFATKGRPPDNPLIVHVSSLAMLRTLLPAAYKPSPAYEILMKHFWPGALTLLFPRDPAIIPSIITADQPTVAIRIPSHPVARALISLTNSPLAAPSANTSGKPSPTKAEHVARDLNGKVGIILDGGVCGVGLESTVVSGLDDDGNIRVLRPGGVTIEDIERLLEQETPGSHPVPRVLVHRRDYQDEVVEQAPTTPGMKYRHYSPSVPVILLLTTSLPPHGMTRIPAESFFASLKERAVDTSMMSVGVLTPSDSPLATYPLPTVGIRWRRYPLGPTTDPSVTAHLLFDGLLTLEHAGVDLILIEEVTEEKEGLAVMNRVRKAAEESRWLRVC